MTIAGKGGSCSRTPSRTVSHASRADPNARFRLPSLGPQRCASSQDWVGFAGPGLAVEWIPRTLRAMGLSMRPFAQASLGLVRMKSPAAFATGRSSSAQDWTGFAGPGLAVEWIPRTLRVMGLFHALL